MNTPGTATQDAATGSTMLVNGIIFGIGVLVTLAFVYYLISDPARLADVWQWVGQQNILVKLGLWVLFLPWLIALWIWQTGWALWLRAILVAGTMYWTNWMLYPWKA